MYKLISRGTIEEAMLRCGQAKLNLEQDVTGQGKGTDDRMVINDKNNNNNGDGDDDHKVIWYLHVFGQHHQKLPKYSNFQSLSINIKHESIQILKSVRLILVVHKRFPKQLLLMF